MRVPPLLAAAGAVLLASLAATSSADAPPGPQRLGDTREVERDYCCSPAPALATAPDGTTVALVTQAGRLVVRRASPGGRFGAARQVPLGSKPTALSAAAGVGFAALAWSHFDASYIPEPGARDNPCCGRVRAALMDRSGRFTRPRTLSAPGTDVTFSLVAVRGRRAVVAWQDARGVRTSVARLGGRGFSRPQTVAPLSGAPLIGVALPRATPHVFFLVGDKPRAVVEVWRSKGATHHRTLGRFGDLYEPVYAAVAPSGRLLLAQSRDRVRASQRRLLVATRRPGRRLRSTTWRIPVADLGDPGVALGPSGIGVVAAPTISHRLMVRPVDRDGRLGSPRSLSIGTRAGTTAAAIDGSGAGVIAIVDYSDTASGLRVRLLAWPLGPGSRPGRRRSLARTRSGISSDPTVTRDGRVAWSEGHLMYGAQVR
jgi:hypothetical protein